MSGSHRAKPLPERQDGLYAVRAGRLPSTAIALCVSKVDQALVRGILRRGRLYLEMTEHIVVADPHVPALRAFLQYAGTAKTVITSGDANRQINQPATTDDSAVLLLLPHGSWDHESAQH